MARNRWDFDRIDSEMEKVWAKVSIIFKPAVFIPLIVVVAILGFLAGVLGPILAFLG